MKGKARDMDGSTTTDRQRAIRGSSAVVTMGPVLLLLVSFSRRVLTNLRAIFRPHRKNIRSIDFSILPNILSTVDKKFEYYPPLERDIK